MQHDPAPKSFESHRPQERFLGALNNQVVLFEMGNRDEAIRRWRRVLKIESNAEPMLALAAALYQRNRSSNDEILTLARDALASDPNYVLAPHQEEQLWGYRIRQATTKLLAEPELAASVERAQANATWKKRRDICGLSASARIQRTRWLRARSTDRPASGDQRSYLEYAMSVIVADSTRCPRRTGRFSGASSAMQELGLTRTVLTGNVPERRRCLGKRSHGDQAVYDALVRLVQTFASRHPLLDGHGNFGSVDDDPAAAMRYTETRLAPIAHQALLEEIGDDTVDFAPNFDGSQQEPTVLPAQLPFCCQQLLRDRGGNGHRHSSQPGRRMV